MIVQTIYHLKVQSCNSFLMQSKLKLSDITFMQWQNIMAPEFILVWPCFYKYLAYKYLFKHIVSTQLWNVSDVWIIFFCCVLGVWKMSLVSRTTLHISTKPHSKHSTSVGNFSAHGMTQWVNKALSLGISIDLKEYI